MGNEVYWCVRINTNPDDDEIILRQRNVYSLIEFLEPFFDSSIYDLNNEKLELDKDILEAIRKDLTNNTFYDFADFDFEDIKNCLDVMEEKLENFESIYFQANW